MTTLAALGLTAPIMLAGMTLLALPIAAHLLHRRARRKVIFPSLMLLTASSASQSQLFKLRRLLLLLLRCLAVVLLVLAFAQPLWLASAQQVGTTDSGAAMVLVVDVSASSAQESGGITAMQNLRAASGRALDGLLSGADRVNLVYADARPRAAFADLSPNLEALRGELEALEPTTERADLVSAIALAGRMLEQHDGPRHLVVVSDLQASNWQGVDEQLAAATALPEGVTVTLVPLEQAQPGNVALVEASVGPYPVVVDQRARAMVELASFADAERTVTVQLHVNDQAVESRSVTLGPWDRRELGFDLFVDQPGSHRITFSIEQADGLALDNRRHLVFRAVQRVPVLVIGDDAPDEPGSATYFLLRALGPHGDARDPYEVRHAAGSEVAGPHLRDAAVIFLSHLGPLPDSLARALHEHLQRGGGLVIFSGDGPVDHNLLTLADRAGETAHVLPWRPTGRHDLTATGDSLTFGQGDWQTPLLRAFTPESRATLEGIRFLRIWSVDDIDPQSQILLRFMDGTPALGMQAVGRGRLLLANFSPALGDSELGKFGSFVALVQQMARTLRPELLTHRSAIAGQSLSFPLNDSVDPQAAPPHVIAPDEQRLADATLAGEAELATVTVPRPGQVGFYRVMQEGRPLGTAAANIDPRESDLRPMDAQLVRKMLESGGAQAQLRTADGTEPVLNLRGRPLWGWLLLLALGALAVESTLVAWWRR